MVLKERETGMYAEYNLVNWEDKLIERVELWRDVSMEKKKSDKKPIIQKGRYQEDKKTLMEFLDSGKRAKAIDYETTREASNKAYRYNYVIEHGGLSGKVKVRQNGNRVILTAKKTRG